MASYLRDVKPDELSPDIIGRQLGNPHNNDEAREEWQERYRIATRHECGQRAEIQSRLIY